MTVTNLVRLATFAALFVTVPAGAAGVTLTNSVLVAQKRIAADGTARIVLVPARHAAPGDRIVYRIAYRNDVGRSIDGFVLSNPVPADLAYRGPAEGSPPPEVSVDGVTFGRLAQLTIRDAAGGARAAALSDVKAVRWRPGTIPVGGTGGYAFEAVIR